MEMNIHSILPEEIAAMGGHSNRVLNEKTGCIGYLTANLNASAPVFESSWHDRTPRLNTPEFTDDFNDMMDKAVLETLPPIRITTKIEDVEDFIRAKKGPDYFMS